jgi:hypothetical protein
METSKTCNIKVVQNNESYNFAFGLISKFQVFLKLDFQILNLNLWLINNSFPIFDFQLMNNFYSNNSTKCTISNHKFYLWDLFW